MSCWFGSNYSSSWYSSLYCYYYCCSSSRYPRLLGSAAVIGNVFSYNRAMTLSWLRRSSMTRSRSCCEFSSYSQSSVLVVAPETVWNWFCDYAFNIMKRAPPLTLVVPPPFFFAYLFFSALTVSTVSLSSCSNSVFMPISL